MACEVEAFLAVEEDGVAGLEALPLRDVHVVAAGCRSPELRRVQGELGFQGGENPRGDDVDVLGQGDPVVDGVAVVLGDVAIVERCRLERDPH
ncbi:hypothetical protein ACL03H_02685 [Saccharopolyspora sp. MS10]|uniref:hypothetical protein n=1 Tax=Saccharopolyspora sp. MS10 TaxID=3385973 RepID=UPI00399F0E16